MTTELDATALRALHEAATAGPWGIWFEQIDGKADAAIKELIDQVHHTDPIGQSLVMLDADGKCPAITGCGPTSAPNASLIAYLRNAVPDILALIEERDRLLAENATLAAGSCDVPGGKIGDEHGHFYCAVQESLADQLEARVKADREVEKLREALTKLRDCDFVIRLPDRMDAVRDIARAALAGEQP